MDRSAERDILPYCLENNIGVLLRAVPLVLDKHPDAVFLFRRGVGSFADEAQLKELSNTLNVAQNIRFMSTSVSREELAGIFNLADIVVSIPSSDAMAISLREAMSCGAIPIVSDLPDNRDIVKDGKHGVILPETTPDALADTLNSCLHDLPNLKRHFMEINPPYIAREHNWQDTVKTMEDLYLETVSNSVPTQRRSLSESTR